MHAPLTYNRIYENQEFLLISSISKFARRIAVHFLDFTMECSVWGPTDLNQHPQLDTDVFFTHK